MRHTITLQAALVLLPLLGTASAREGGVGSTGGGDAVVCFAKDARGIALASELETKFRVAGKRAPLSDPRVRALFDQADTVESLDYYDASREPFFSSDPKAVLISDAEVMSEGGPHAYALKVIGKLSQFSELGMDIAARIKLGSGNEYQPWSASEGVGEVHDDASVYQIPSHCALIQAAVNHEDGETHINKHVFARLPPAHQVALILHEMIYREFRATLRHWDSKAARKAVALLLEKSFLTNGQNDFPRRFPEIRDRIGFAYGCRSTIQPIPGAMLLTFCSAMDKSVSQANWYKNLSSSVFMEMLEKKARVRFIHPVSIPQSAHQSERFHHRVGDWRYYSPIKFTANGWNVTVESTRYEDVSMTLHFHSSGELAHFDYSSYMGDEFQMLFGDRAVRLASRAGVVRINPDGEVHLTAHGACGSSHACSAGRATYLQGKQTGWVDFVYDSQGNLHRGRSDRDYGVVDGRLLSIVDLMGRFGISERKAGRMIKVRKGDTVIFDENEKVIQVIKAGVSP